MARDLSAAAPHATGRLVVPAAEFAATAAGRIRDLLVQAIASRGVATIALAGGSTPRPVYECLAGLPPPPWIQVAVYFGDERAVPPSDSASNYRMASVALLDRVPIPAANVYRMEAERVERERAAGDYARLLPSALDVVLLGIGEDGHTASLFPHSPALHETQRRVVPVIGPSPPPARLTVTPPVLAAARAVVVLATGAAKAAPVARALDDAVPIVECPAGLARSGLWILDEAAAHDLQDVRR